MSLRFTRFFASVSPRLTSPQRRSFATGSLTAAGTLLSPPLLPHVAPSLAPLIVALLLLHAHSDEEDAQEAFTENLPLSRNVPYYVRDVNGAGKGAFAAREIKRGEVLITDSPLLVWPQGMEPAEAEDLYDHLTPRAKEVFGGLVDSMDKSKGLGEVLGRRATNGFNVVVPTVPEGAKATKDLSTAQRVSFLYPNIARINHSCLPNADNAIQWSNLRMTVYAATTIPSSAQINIEYVPMATKTRSERQALLKEHFGFDCACQACAASPVDVAQSDARRREVGELARQVAKDGTLGTAESRRGVVRGLERIRSLLEAEGYNALPEFDDDVVSRAFVLYIANRAQLNSTDL